MRYFWLLCPGFEPLRVHGGSTGLTDKPWGWCFFFVSVQPRKPGIHAGLLRVWSLASCQYSATIDQLFLPSGKAFAVSVSYCSSVSSQLTSVKQPAPLSNLRFDIIIAVFGIENRVPSVVTIPFRISPVPAALCNAGTASSDHQTAARRLRRHSPRHGHG